MLPVPNSSSCQRDTEQWRQTWKTTAESVRKGRKDVDAEIASIIIGDETETPSMIVTGFIEPLVKGLPMEYAVEMNRLIELQVEGSVGSTS